MFAGIIDDRSAHDTSGPPEFNAKFILAATAHLNMPNDRFTSAVVYRGYLLYSQLFSCELNLSEQMDRAPLSGENSMSYQARPSASQVFREFHCRRCGPQDALRSSPRGFFEKYILPFLFLRVVRCERCYHRRYIFRSVPVMERYSAEPKAPQRARVSDSTEDTGNHRIA